MLVTSEASFGPQPLDSSQMAGATLDAFPAGMEPTTFVDHFPTGYENRFGNQPEEAPTEAVAVVEASSEMVMAGAVTAARG